jgi:spore coat polysaccharide biosynthesis protein SpsF (cytidylyltransferase family)
MLILAIIQARMGSTRLPGKVLKPFGDTTVIKYMLERVEQSKLIDLTVVATSTNQENDALVDHLADYETYRGNEDNVLSRFYEIAQRYQPNLVVRLTADCPFIDSQLIDETIQQTIDAHADYGSNVNPATYPDGVDIEVFTYEALENAAQQATKQYDLEHVTPYIWRHAQNPVNKQNDTNYRYIRWTLDTQEDYENLTKMVQLFDNNTFTWKQMLDKVQS